MSLKALIGDQHCFFKCWQPCGVQYKFIDYRNYTFPYNLVVCWHYKSTELQQFNIQVVPLRLES